MKVQVLNQTFLHSYLYLKDMFSWDSLDSKGKEIVRDMFSDKL